MGWYNTITKESATQSASYLANLIMLLISQLGMSEAQAKSLVNKDPVAAQKQVSQKQTNQQVASKSALISPESVMPMISRHEGRRYKVYRDTLGIPHIGVGFNLQRSDARTKLQNVGANYNTIINGAASLNDQQIDALLKQDTQNALSQSQQFLPNIAELNQKAQMVVVDMMFNLGPNRLGAFKEFQAALLIKDYSRAADEMLNSKWSSQVGNRSLELAAMMRSIVQKPN